MIIEEKTAEFNAVTKRIMETIAGGEEYIPMADVRRYNQLMQEIWGDEIGADPELKEEK